MRSRAVKEKVKHIRRAVGRHLRRKICPRADQGVYYIGSVDDVSHLLKAAYNSRGKRLLFDVDLNEILTLGFSGFLAGRDGLSPFYHTLIEYKLGKSIDYEGSALQKYYELCRPKNNWDTMGLRDDDRPAEAFPPLAAGAGGTVLWRNDSPEHVLTQRKEHIKLEDLEHGYQAGAEHGDPFYGPVSVQKGRIEFARLVKVYQSILADGYKPDCEDHGYVKVYVLTDGFRYRFSINGGQHRVAAMAANGFDRIKVELSTSSGIGGFVFREHCKIMKLNNTCLYGHQRLRIFDRLLDGEPAPWAEDWADYLGIAT